MATIANAVFGESSDEEDEDYVDSGPSSDDDGEEDGDGEKVLSHSEKVFASIRSKKMSRLLRELQIESEANAKHIPTVRKSDILLQFQKPCPKYQKPKHTAASFLQYVQTARGECLASEDDRRDLRAYKHACRHQEQIEQTNDNTTITKDTDDNSTNDKCVAMLGAEVVVDQKVRFAGETITIQKKLLKDSKEYRQHVLQQERDTQANREGGPMSMQNLMQAFGKPKSITSVQKSLSDWQNFKSVAGLEDELRKNRKDGFLGRQQFLATAEHRREQHRQDAKRRRMLSTQPPAASPQ